MIYLEVPEPALDAVLVKVPDEQTAVVVRVRPALAVLLLQRHHGGVGLVLLGGNVLGSAHVEGEIRSEKKPFSSRWGFGSKSSACVRAFPFWPFL